MTALDLAILALALALFGWLLTSWMEKPTIIQAISWVLLMSGCAWALIGATLMNLGVI